MFWEPFFLGLDGFEKIQNPDDKISRQYVPDIGAFLEAGHKPRETFICTGKINHIGSTYVDPWNHLKNLLPKERQREAKLTLAAPNWYHLRCVSGRHTQRMFPRRVVLANRVTADFCSEKMLAAFQRDNEDASTLLDKYIKLYNDYLRNRPTDLHIDVHLGRGNFVGSRHFSKARARGFEPLKELPRKRTLITSKFSEMESIEELKMRVNQAAGLLAEGSGETKQETMNRLGVNPQCRFASHSDGNVVKKEDMMNKLKLVSTLANELCPDQP
ncbi:hypothetical protein BJ875DRAFT_503997 [Amylocarpus encephaloides]|uniref:Uncharacterized protein n=1 Tax=Amylocarpus encephaloides TaxID=45428 RepID=A0A9P8C6L8_9HELO|nr:hypothetical protein BJ875DRAFT_503997 [Amylocarpus encephaloides]